MPSITFSEFVFRFYYSIIEHFAYLWAIIALLLESYEFSCLLSYSLILDLKTLIKLLP